MLWTEWIGYLGSTLIALSMIINNVWRMRWVNLAGVVAFVVYGWLVQAWPVVILNAVIIGADLYYLIRLGNQVAAFTLQPVDPSNTEYLQRFCRFHARDLQRLFPGFDLEHYPKAKHLFIERDLQPAGLFSYSPQSDGRAVVHADYVIPAYRDYKVARYLFDCGKERLEAEGIRLLLAKPMTQNHEKYLRKVGFTPDRQDQRIWQLALGENPEKS